MAGASLCCFLRQLCRGLDWKWCRWGWTGTLIWEARIVSGQLNPWCHSVGPDVFRFHIWVRSCCTCVSVPGAYFVQHSDSTSIHVIAVDDGISSFYGWTVFHCVFLRVVRCTSIVFPSGESKLCSHPQCAEGSLFSISLYQHMFSFALVTGILRVARYQEFSLCVFNVHFPDA